MKEIAAQFLITVIVSDFMYVLSSKNRSIYGEAAIKLGLSGFLYIPVHGLQNVTRYLDVRASAIIENCSFLYFILFMSFRYSDNRLMQSRV